MATETDSDRLSRVTQELQTSEAFRVQSRFEILENSYYIFYRNSDGLLRLLDGPGEEYAFFVAKMMGSYELSVWVMREFMRRLHNFCASAMTLVEHIRPLIRKKWYADTALCKEYDARISRDFENDGLHHFVQDLRNYVLHNTTPPTGLHVAWKWSQDSARFDLRFTLGRDQLLQWNRWDHNSRAFIGQLEADIEVNGLVRGYTEKVRDLQIWLYRRMEHDHSTELAYVAAMQEEIRQLHEKVFGPDIPVRSGTINGAT